MRKIIMIIIFILMSLRSGFAQEEIDPKQKYVLTGEQIIRQQWHLASLQQEVFNLTYALNEKEIEIIILKSQVEEWKYKYEQSRKGFWTGLGVGYPLGAQGIILYQFNERIGVFMVGGFNSIWSINAGIITRIK